MILMTIFFFSVSRATIETRLPIVYLDVGMEAGAEPFVTEIDADMEGFVYVYTGSVQVGPEGNEKLVRAGEVIVLTPGNEQWNKKHTCTCASFDLEISI
jgi:hypothetical protein